MYSLCTAACVHVHARSIKACFSCSVLDLRAQRTASSAYCRNPSALDIATLLTTPPSCGACALPPLARRKIFRRSVLQTQPPSRALVSPDDLEHIGGGR